MLILFVGALSFPDGPRKIDTWTSRNNLPISLYNIGSSHPGQFPESRPCLKVVCRPYEPLEGECCSKSWIKGSDKVEIPLPTFAIPASKLNETAQNLQNLVDSSFDMLVDELGADQDEIVSCTLAEAARQANKVSECVGFWVTLLICLFIQVFHTQGCSDDFHHFSTGFKKLQHLRLGNSGYRATTGP